MVIKRGLYIRDVSYHSPKLINKKSKIKEECRKLQILFFNLTEDKVQGKIGNIIIIIIIIGIT
jgi:hypothetical protein